MLVCPTGALVKKGESVAEMEKQTEFLKYIVTARRKGEWISFEHRRRVIMRSPTMKPKVATVWLGGCSGCHMSFLDLDERLIELADKIDAGVFADCRRQRVSRAMLT